MDLYIRAEELAWTMVAETVEEGRQDGGVVDFQSTKVQYEYLLQSAPLRLPLGVYEFHFRADQKQGEIIVCVLDEARNTWIGQANVEGGNIGSLRFSAPLLGRKVRLIVTANNANEPGIVEAVVETIGVFRTANPGVLTKNALKEFKERFRRWVQIKWKPKFYLTRLWWQVIACRLSVAFKKSGPGQPSRYRIVDSARVGHAVRGIEVVKTSNGKSFVVTADVGDDTCSVLPVVGGRLKTRRVISFPHQSRPMYVMPWPAADGSVSPAVCLFNFDVSGRDCDKTRFIVLEDFERLSMDASVIDPDQDATVVLSRDGYWGYRGGAVMRRGDGSYCIGVADREKALFHLLEGQEGLRPGTFKKSQIHLGDRKEPIGVAVSPVTKEDPNPDFFINSRSHPELTVLGIDENRQPFLKQTIPVRGLSRSSVAVGRFSKDGPLSVVVALWGGNPKNLNSEEAGEVAVIDINEDNAPGEPYYFPAGIHPTDVAAGDFDGDGIDELAVLNYGSGLGAVDRTHPGGVQIFKWVEGAFKLVDSIALANPRIAAVADIDGDGRQELLVSLFFENRLCVIKCL